MLLLLLLTFWMFAGTITSWAIKSPQELAVIPFALVSFTPENDVPATIRPGTYFSSRCKQGRVIMSDNMDDPEIMTRREGGGRMFMNM